MIKEIRDAIRELGLNDLPTAKKLLRKEKNFLKNVHITPSLFLKKHGVKSEYEFKRKMMQRKEIMFHMQFGLTDIEKSVEGLLHVYEEVTKAGHEIHRFGLCMDRAMGLPGEMRDLVPRETGLKLRNMEEWEMLGQTVPIQPHFADPIISSPNAVENLLGCYRAGATTFGNFCTYYNFEYPLWTDDVLRLSNMLKALGIMAGMRDQGVMVHSNMDDGFCGMFYDRSSIVGWAMLDYYIVNDLIGARLTHCMGNMVDSILQRMSSILVLDRIHHYDLVGSMVYGDTISPTPNPQKNYATTASYLLGDIVMQMYHPTGHAVNPLPTTENLVIPTPDDIINIQLVGGQLAHEAEHMYEVTDFEKIERFADETYKNGEVFYNRIMDAFADVIDITDPLKLMYGLKHLGAERIENFFCEKTPFHGSALDRQPYIETGIYKKVTNYIQDVLGKISLSDEQMARIKNKKVMVGCTDVHSFAVKITHAVLKKLGFDVVNLGANVDPEHVIDAIESEHPEAVVLSTNNGFALSYSQKLKQQMEDHGLWDSCGIIMGGHLNEDAGQSVPVDVTEDLSQLGVHPSTYFEDIPDLIDSILVNKQ